MKINHHLNDLIHSGSYSNDQNKQKTKEQRKICYIEMYKRSQVKSKSNVKF